jgi:Heliorhodopsin
MSQRWHQIAAGLHAGQAGVLAYLLATSDKKLEWPLIQSTNGEVKHRTTQDIFVLLPLFSGLSTLNHATMGWSDSFYANVQKNRSHPLQWAEYSVSAGLMTWVLAVMSGVVDLSVLISLLELNIMMQYTGYCIEKAVAEGTDPMPYLYLGWGAFMAIWTILLSSFITALTYASSPVPDIVHAIIWILLAFFASFGINQYLYMRKYTTWEQYQKGTIALSLCSKSSLVWMCYFGIVRA